MAAASVNIYMFEKVEVHFSPCRAPWHLVVVY